MGSGNLHDVSFEEIWNGTRMQTLRSDILRGRVNRICGNASCKFIKNTEAAKGKGVKSVVQAFTLRARKKVGSKARRLLRPAWKRIPLESRAYILKIWEKLYWSR
jgi:hypothetical protein